MLKDNIKNTRTTSLASLLCFNVNFEQALHLFLVFLLLNLGKQMLARTLSRLINDESKVEISF